MNLEKVEESLKSNLDAYGCMISISALFKKLYGKFPKIGLSGQQASYADEFLETLPDPN